MLFNSLGFAIFLPLVFVAFWALPNRWRWALLLVASYVFYVCWNAVYLLLIVGVTLTAYGCALGIEKAQTARGKKLWLLANLICSLGVLVAFKYFNFFSNELAELLRRLFSLNIHPVTLQVLLPIGISFYTFQSLSYTIDVYRGDISAERHAGVFAAYIAFFPQLVAGPIERSRNLLPQIKNGFTFDENQAVYGLKLMAWGLFKKMVIADGLAFYVDRVFNAPTNYRGFALAIAAVLFSFQIYCDFSGYSDIAVGVAKLFNVELMTNFKSPYFSTSIKEFWSRWHISLSTWFRDYVYIPLGGNRRGRPCQCLNLLLTFLLSGLWHGASLTFVIWGGIHGAAQAAETLLLGNKRRQFRGWGRLPLAGLTFLFCTLSWVIFRAATLGDAGYILAHMLDGVASPAQYLMDGIKLTFGVKEELVELIMMFALLFAYDAYSLRGDVIAAVSARKPWVRWTVYTAFLLLFLALLPLRPSTAFLYFQF